jgi:hypothetical protein
MLIVSAHAIKRYRERVEDSDYNIAKEKIYSLVINNFTNMLEMSGQYPIGNKHFAIVRDCTVVTITRQSIVCETRVVNNKKKYKKPKYPIS